MRTRDIGTGQARLKFEGTIAAVGRAVERLVTGARTGRAARARPATALRRAPSLAGLLLLLFLLILPAQR